MSHSLELGYAVVEVDDGDAASRFFTDVVGLAPGAPTPAGHPTWTDDDVVQRVIVTRGPADDLVALGFEAVDDAAFDATVEGLAGAGFEVRAGDDAEVAERRVGRLAAVDAPWGSAVEVAVGLTRGAWPDLPLVPGGFLTAGQGFGHAVIGTTAFDESVRFVTDGLGLVQSDWLEMELAAGIDLEVHFFHCNARHHSLALARAPFELPKLHHLMFEANRRDDVGAAFDRALAAGLPLPNGLGVHDNDRMFSFYVESPAGFQVEVGHGARQITEPWTDDRRYDRISVWGHQPVAHQAGG
jgi:2,3-dihydroxybiphenyl 1,2-dioxygenase